MATVFPAQIDSSLTLPTLRDNISVVSGSSVNILRDAILAIEACLGTKPQGIYSTVRARLDVLEATLFNQQGAGSIISYGIPEPGQTIVWNGTYWGPTLNGGNNFLYQNISTTGGLTSGPAESTSQTTGLFELTGKVVVNAITTSYISDPGQGIIYFDGYTNQFLVSQDGYGYIPLISSGSFFASGDLSGTGSNQVVVGIQTVPISATSPTTSQVLTYNGTEWAPITPSTSPTGTAGGDLGGTYPNPTVIALQGNVVQSGTLGALDDGYVLTWVNTNSEWEAKPVSSSGGNEAVIFTDTTTGIKSNRSSGQSPVGLGLTGVTNLGSDSTGFTSGITANYATVSGGDQNVASAEYSTISGGFQNYSQGIASYAEGQGTSSEGNASHSEGLGTSASGDGSHSEGNATQATANSSHAEGQGTTASGLYSHAEGFENQAQNNSDHAEGSSCVASGGSSHAEGGSSVASGPNSHAEGNGKAQGTSSHAQGSSVAANDYSDANGYNAYSARLTQVSWASGIASSAILSDSISQQTSLLVLRGSTPGTSANETVSMSYGIANNANPGTLFALTDGKAYTVNVELIARSAAGGIKCRSLCLRSSVRCDSGVVTVAGSEALASFGDAGFAAFTLTMTASSGNLLVTFGTGSGVTALTNVVAKIQFTETF